MISFGEQPVKNEEDGMYYVRASKEGGKKVFIQLNKVTVESESAGTVALALGENNTPKVEDIDALVLATALENSNAWFGRELTETALASAYTKSTLEGSWRSIAFTTPGCSTPTSNRWRSPKFRRARN
jgi:hypothetical protein